MAVIFITLLQQQEECFWGRVDRLVGQVLAVQACAPEFASLSPMKRLSVAALLCVSAGEPETGESQSLLTSQCGPISELRFSELVSKIDR